MKGFFNINRQSGLRCLASLLLVATVNLSAVAGSKTSANYSITTDAIDSGGRRITSATYINDGSIGNVSGPTSTGAAGITVKSGYLAQLSDSPPTISVIADQTVSAGSNTGALAFTVGDAETPAASLTVTGSSSNTSLVPNVNIVFGGAGVNRTVTVTPAAGQTGSASVTVTVSDSVLTALSSFTLTVIPATQVILFTGPPDQPFSTTPISLSATASSGLPVSFSVVSGPATVSGSNLTLTGAGPITLRAVQAGDGTYAVATPVERTFTVSPNLLLWQINKFTSAELADQAKSGPNAVFGLDGLSNLIKYALGLEPKQNITSGLPSITVVGTEWVYTYTRPSSVTDVTYAVEVSSNLTTWSAVGLTHELVTSVGGVETWRARIPLSTAPIAFFRLKVTQP